MTKKSAKSARITVNGYDLSTAAVSYEVVEGSNAEDATGFQQGVQNFAPGQAHQEVTVDFLYDDYGASGSFSILKALVGSTSPFPVTVRPVPDGQTFTLQAIMDGGITVAGESKGGLTKLGSVKFVPGSGTLGTWA